MPPPRLPSAGKGGRMLRAILGKPSARLHLSTSLVASQRNVKTDLTEPRCDIAVRKGRRADSSKCVNRPAQMVAVKGATRARGPRSNAAAAQASGGPTGAQLPRCSTLSSGGPGVQSLGSTSHPTAPWQQQRV